MKLRIHRNSLRVRVSQSEVAQFVGNGWLEETIYFGRDADAGLTYVLSRDNLRQEVEVEYAQNRVTILLPAAQVNVWSVTEQVEIAGEVDLGVNGTLSVLVEKDFACLDRSDQENADTFPNPLAANVC